jgi:hypothetical protein
MPPVDRLAVVGLLLGAVFGLLGTVVPQPGLRQLFWGIDGAGLVMATSLLAIRYFKKGSDCVAAGFLVFAIGEGLLLAGIAAGLEGSVPSFGGGTVLWATALFMVSGPRELTQWVRLSGMVAAILFTVVSLRIFLGERLLPTSTPLPFFGYPFLVLTFVGWIWTLVSESRRRPS